MIDKAGVGLSVQCPKCNQSLIVPTECTTDEPKLQVGFGNIFESAIQSAALAIESGIFDDDQKLDDYLRKEKPEVLATSYGKKQAKAFLEGKIDGKTLMNSGFKFSPKEFARLKPQFDAIGKQPKK